MGGAAQGEDPSVNERDGDGWTALMHASAEGHIAAVEALLAAGASSNVGEDTHDKWTALTHAASNDAEAVVALLVGAGADVNHTDVQGWTALP